MSIANILCSRKLAPTGGGSSDCQWILSPHLLLGCPRVLWKISLSHHWRCLPFPLPTGSHREDEFAFQSRPLQNAQQPDITFLHLIRSPGRQGDPEGSEPVYDIDHSWFSSLPLEAGKVGQDDFSEQESNTSCPFPKPLIWTHVHLNMLLSSLSAQAHKYRMLPPPWISYLSKYNWEGYQLWSQADLVLNSASATG